jgi:ATP-binding cassette subfamily C protein
VSHSPNTDLTAVRDRDRGAMRMLVTFARAYPSRSALALLSVLVAGLVDGLGMSMLLSMLTFATGEASATPSAPQKVALKVAEFLGMAPTAFNL